MTEDTEAQPDAGEDVITNNDDDDDAKIRKKNCRTHAGTFIAIVIIALIIVATLEILGFFNLDFDVKYPNCTVAPYVIRDGECMGGE